MPRKTVMQSLCYLASVSLLNFDLLIIYSNMQLYIYFSNFVTYSGPFWTISRTRFTKASLAQLFFAPLLSNHFSSFFLFHPSSVALFIVSGSHHLQVKNHLKVIHLKAQGHLPLFQWATTEKYNMDKVSPFPQNTCIKMLSSLSMYTFYYIFNTVKWSL